MLEGRRITKLALAAATTLGLHSSDAPQSNRRVEQCFATLKQPEHFKAEYPAIKKAIRETLPTLNTGTKAEVADALWNLGKKVKTESYIRGSDFLESWPQFPGVKIEMEENIRTGEMVANLQPLGNLNVDNISPSVDGQPGDNVQTWHGNGTVVTFEGRTFLLTNDHVLSSKAPRAIEAYESATKRRITKGEYHLDVAVIELRDADIPEDINPVPLSVIPEEDFIGSPFYIPGIHPEARKPDLSSVVVTTGFTMPISNHIVAQSGDVTLETKQTTMHGGIHEDCRGGFGGLYLAGFSGSGTYDDKNRFLGVFYGGLKIESPKREDMSIKITGFVSVNKIIDAIQNKTVKKPSIKVNWVK